MWNSRQARLIASALAACVLLLSGCTGLSLPQPDSRQQPAAPPAQTPGNGGAEQPGKSAAPDAPGALPGSTAKDQPPAGGDATAKPPAGGKEGAVQVIAKPAEIAVLVNKLNKLPDNYKPQDLVDPDVAFIFKEKLEKRKMRKEAAASLEKLFQAAKEAGYPLAGVSAYRSHQTQTSLYNNYVKQHGEQEANTFSAKPGQSEHETGLAIDVAGANGKCPAQDCFGATKEAKWLAEHASEYGFIIRYPKGKEAITGYQYEPWHLRYVGVQLAKELTKQGLTLEEYYSKGVPVNKPSS
ncbi:D-alanyl-D-alanine carboxypeptidase [Paenibacillus sp. UNCCL117]|uniref:M15 family metallopeptidase n=1 Tax=unclassified Paenibacillus TaxID=185978 RepID=UPI00088DB352|nr:MULTISPECIES: M15 family metallopeptidase [unclassified Paenibacillus]SDD63474.1 D-alanyl-D-alanine carboxypeptidase [Paenibacillus sp. cl123]SFW58516.1 D-alanyl-D-alanine carboxypeptidase [Paenibacillus sp. UNCCL117]